MTAGRPRIAGAIAHVIVVGALASTTSASADRYEATFEVRPRAGLAKLVEPAANGADASATTTSAGLDLAGAWGVRNALDVGVQLGGSWLARAEHDGAFPVQGNAVQGTLTRTSREAHVLGTATLRVGVGIVGSFTVGLGPGIRSRSASMLSVPADPDAPDGPRTTVVPDDAAGGTTFDVVAMARAGVDVRINRRWSLGAAVTAMHHQGLGAPSLQHLEGGITLAYRWYPLW